MIERETFSPRWVRFRWIILPETVTHHFSRRGAKPKREDLVRMRDLPATPAGNSGISDDRPVSNE